MPLFAATTHLTHRFPLPITSTSTSTSTPTTTSSFPSFSTIIAILHDDDWLLRLDPELESYTLSDPDPDPESNSNIHAADAEREVVSKTKPKPKPKPKTKTYHVIDHMAGISKSLMDPKIHIEIQITDVDDGVDFLIHAPMGVVQRSWWRVVPVSVAVSGSESERGGVGKAEVDAEAGKGKGKGPWQLVIETEITCSRLWMGFVRGKGEANAPRVGRALRGRLEGEEREREREREG